ncbi:hypothetical protein BM1_03148 [Bipolaris maydis]|nr:hypothetical protein BM1_03148 [Bipolaris maydis]
MPTDADDTSTHEKARSDAARAAASGDTTCPYSPRGLSAVRMVSMPDTPFHLSQLRHLVSGAFAYHPYSGTTRDLQH